MALPTPVVALENSWKGSALGEAQALRKRRKRARKADLPAGHAEPKEAWKEVMARNRQKSVSKPDARFRIYRLQVGITLGMRRIIGLFWALWSDLTMRLRQGFGVTVSTGEGFSRGLHGGHG